MTNKVALIIGAGNSLGSSIARVFANGALQAVKWGMNKGPGLFSMTDVLNI